MADTINWAIIGGGKVVEKKSGPAFNHIPGSQLRSIMRRNSDKAQETAQLLGASRWSCSIDELLDDKEVNAVYIATPPGLHLEQARACKLRGLPVYIEKPFARNFYEASIIVDEFEAASVPIFAAHYRRALPRFQRLGTLISEEAIGKIIEIDFRLNRKAGENNDHPWLFRPEISGGGKFIDIAPHSIDVFVLLFGSLKNIHGIPRNFGSSHNLEDVVVMSFETEAGAIGTANFNFLSDSRSDQLTIYGTRGFISASIHGNDPIRISIDGHTHEEDIRNPTCIEEPMIAEVVKALQGLPSNACPGRSALETYRIIDKVMGITPQ